MGERNLRSERGQAVVFVAIAAASMVMMAALVVEGGRLLLERRDMQGTADAAAMAGVRQVPTDQSGAEETAIEYAMEKNPDEPVEFVAEVNGARLEVRAVGEVQGSFLGLFDGVADVNRVEARAVAAARSAIGVGRALPMALMQDAFTYGDNTEIKTRNALGPGNHGAVRLEEPPGCPLSSGANDFRNFILTEEGGGMSACATEIGSNIATEPGNMSGPTRQGLDGRIGGSNGIGGNDDSFEDVFELDPATGRYKVLKPNSPRLGVVPIVLNTNGSNAWPNGQAGLEIVGYTYVYIGNPGAGNRYYSDNGRQVWVTPVEALAPREWEEDIVYSDYDPTLESPIAFRLVE